MGRSLLSLLESLEGFFKSFSVIEAGFEFKINSLFCWSWQIRYFIELTLYLLIIFEKKVKWRVSLGFI